MEVDEIKEELFKFPYFNQWSEEVIKECSGIAKIKSVNSDSILIGEVGSDPDTEDMTHFILEGTCQIIFCSGKVIKPKQNGFLEEEEDKNQDLYSTLKTGSRSIKLPPLLPDGKYPSDYHLQLLSLCQQSERKKIEKKFQKKTNIRFIQCAFLKKGGCFNIGENLKDRYIISSSDLTCLLIPRQFLMQHNPHNIWNRIKQFLVVYFPSNEKVLEEVKINAQWLRYKNEEVMRIANKNKRKTNVQTTDIPLSLRMMKLKI